MSKCRSWGGVRNSARPIASDLGPHGPYGVHGSPGGPWAHPRGPGEWGEERPAWPHRFLHSFQPRVHRVHGHAGGRNGLHGDNEARMACIATQGQVLPAWPHGNGLRGHTGTRIACMATQETCMATGPGPGPRAQDHWFCTASLITHRSHSYSLKKKPSYSLRHTAMQPNTIGK